MHFVPLNYSDPGFNPVFTADFELLIIINQKTFSYAVRHPGTQRLVRVSTNHQLNELFDPENQLEAFRSSYQKVAIAVETDSFFLIPNAIFNPENLLDFAAFLSVKEADVILTDHIENGQNTVIFTFPEELVRKVEKLFPSTKIEFAPKTWIKIITETQLSGQNLYLLLKENQLHIFYPDQGNIRFYNQFSCSTINELIYYTALVAEQLKLKPEETDLILCGRVVAGSEHELRLKDFFKDVILFSTPYFKQRNSLQQHQVVQLLGLV